MQTELEITPNTVIPILKNELMPREEYRKLGKRVRETIDFPFGRIKVREGHNGRTKDNPGFSIESLTELARSIFIKGLLKPLVIDVLKNGDGIITEGERRWRAIGIIRQWIADGIISELFQDDPSREIPTFDFVECFINPAKTTQLDRDMMMLLENMARVDLTPMEQAESIARLKAGGMSQATIAKSVPGLSTMMVSLRLKLASISPAEKELVAEGKISPTAAAKLAGEESDPEKRIAMINEAAGGEDGKLKIKAIVGENGITDIDPETGEILKETFPGQNADNDNSLRDGDLTGASSSEPIDPKDDPSLKGTSPKASESNRDPAQKAKDDIDQSDARITSGKATAFDLVIKVMGIVKQFDLETEGEQKNNPKLTTLIFEADKVLYDLKAILKK